MFFKFLLFLCLFMRSFEHISGNIVTKLVIYWTVTYRYSNPYMNPHTYPNPLYEL